MAAGHTHPKPREYRGSTYPAKAVSVLSRALPGIMPDTAPIMSKMAATRVKAVVQT